MSFCKDDMEVLYSEIAITSRQLPSCTDKGFLSLWRGLEGNECDNGWKRSGKETTNKDKVDVSQWWRQLSKWSCFIRWSAIGEQRSPHVGYRFTVDDKINAEKSRGEGSQPLYLEQVAIHAWKEMICSCDRGLTPTHRSLGWLSPGFSHLPWLPSIFFSFWKSQ